MNASNVTNEMQIDLHPVLKDLENTFYLFILANVLLGDPEVQNRAKTKQEIIKPLESYNSWVGLKIKVQNGTYETEANLLGQMIFLGKAISILMYDILSASKYQTKICRLEIYKF